MRQPRHVRLPLLDDAAWVELGDRALWDLTSENTGLHWIGVLSAATTISDAFYRHWVVTRRFAGAPR